ncbi:MAG: hypothetical protein J5I93_21350 [Pirellulaceae bacterium]|nr:hypothetical protein [Pirellulaceae bacterium]
MKRSPSLARGPVCLEGERACPPEDVGRIWGYAEKTIKTMRRGMPVWSQL